ncbi:MAG: LytTR family DNA-binding domain-containing protein [Chitinophagales bacterium]
MKHLLNETPSNLNINYILYCTDSTRCNFLLQQFNPIISSDEIILLHDLISLCNYKTQDNQQIIFLDLHSSELPLEIYQFVFNKFNHVVIISGQSSHAVWAFEYGAIDFMLDPVNTHRVSTTIQKIKPTELIKSPKADNDTIFVKNSRDLIKLNLSEIIYIQAMGNYIRIYLVNNKCITSLEKISFIEHRLPTEQFMRIHKSFIINNRFIKSFDKKEVILINETVLPLSITYRHGLTGKYMGHAVL